MMIPRKFYYLSPEIQFSKDCIYKVKVSYFKCVIERVYWVCYVCMSRCVDQIGSDGNITKKSHPRKLILTLQAIVSCHLRVKY